MKNRFKITTKIKLLFWYYNPLSYIFLILIPIIGVLMFGFVGFWKEIDYKNPFKWQ